ncbi:MAG: hypothetical protein H7067_15060 [Burkholderiales bacterium]|nr:hypothetical protein [Opitutaceae bacterium]
MPIFNFIFWGLVVAFLGGGLVVSGTITAIAKRRKRPALKWIFGTAFVIFAAIAGTLISVIGYGLYRSSTPTLVFEDTFHEKPPFGTKVLHGSGTGFADSAGVEVSFLTDRATFDRLRPAKLEATSLETYNSYFSSFNRSKFREPTSKTEIWWFNSSPFTYQRMPEGQNFSSEVTFMTWDADGLVQYMWSGID